MSRRHAHVLLAALLVGCNAAPVRLTGTFTLPASTRSHGPSLREASPLEETLTTALQRASRPAQVLGQPADRAFQTLSLDGLAPLAGHVTLGEVQNGFFADSGAPYRVRDLAAAHALVYLAGLYDEQVLGPQGLVHGTSDGGGAFELPDAPDTPLVVVNAMLGNNHHVASLAAGGQRDVRVDEAGASVLATLRWHFTDLAALAQRLAAWPAPGLPTDLPGRLAWLQNSARQFLTPAQFPAMGDTPDVEPLKFGNELSLRNLLVGSFGPRVTPDGSGTADQLSDALAALLGYRPVSTHVAAGVGRHTTGQEDKTPGAGQDPFAYNIHPLDLAVTEAGDLVIADLFGIFAQSSADRGPWDGALNGLQAGKLYRIIGNGTQYLDTTDYMTAYGPAEARASLVPSAAPLAASFPILEPQRICYQPPQGAAHGDVFYADGVLGRVFMVPGKDQQRFGRTLLADHLYTLMGQSPLVPAGVDATFVQAGPDGVNQPPELDAGRAFPPGPVAAGTTVQLFALAHDRENQYVPQYWYDFNGQLAGAELFSFTAPSTPGDRPLVYRATDGTTTLEATFMVHTDAALQTTVLPPVIVNAPYALTTTPAGSPSPGSSDATSTPSASPDPGASATTNASPSPDASPLDPSLYWAFPYSPSFVMNGARPEDFPLEAPPSALTVDDDGNLLVAIPSTGIVACLASGTMVSVPVSLQGHTYLATPSAMRTRRTAEGNFLYATDPNRHIFFRVQLPDHLDTRLLEPLPMDVIAGQPDQPGLFDGSVAPLDWLNATAGVSRDHVRLNTPASFDFDAAGNVILADYGNQRIRLITPDGTAGPGRVYTIAGGVNLPNLEGDSRLCTFGATSAVCYDAVHRQTYANDIVERYVRRLDTRRGTI